jgi:anti-repressor protein
MTDMKNFIYNGMNVRTAVVNGESWFVAADICRILDIGNPSDTLSRLDDDEKNTLVLTEGIPGNPEKRVVNEAGLYTLILRSRKPEARAFKRWVTHEVLPAIRKTGIYATEAILDNPDLAIAALTKLKEERNRARELAQINAAQQQQIAELRPKATYYDLVLQCRDLVNTSTIAKDYGWSANRMNQWLHEHGIQYKQGNIWLLYQAYAPMGYTSTKTFNIPDGNGVLHNRVHTYWTQKGRLFIYRLMTEEGNYPLIEKGRGDSGEI